MRALARVTDVANRLATPRDVDAWIHLVGGHGRVVGGRYATLFEMSPSQLVDGATQWSEALGYPGATPTQIRWVAQRQQTVYRHAYSCCVASRWAADSLVRDHHIAARKVHVVGYGRNANLALSRERNWDAPRFLFIGRDWQRKNGDAVVRAFVRLRREVPDVQLDVVGGHPRLGEKGVTEHGSIEVSDAHGRVQLEALFARATCFVLPSCFEPFGIVYVEAAAAGLPSIAGAIGGTADSVGPGGLIVDPHDDDGIYRAMRDLCDADTARHLGAIAQARSAAFTWSATTQRMLCSLDLAPMPGVEPSPLP